jgi:hypothetical protein
MKIDGIEGFEEFEMFEEFEEFSKPETLRIHNPSTERSELSAAKPKNLKRETRNLKLSYHEIG